MTQLCWILGDQLSDSIAALQAIDPHQDLVLMCEVREEATYVQHHPKKIAFLFSAMRHFAEHLRQRGYRVRYTYYDDPANTGSFEHELLRAVREEQIASVHVTYPGEWRVLNKIQTLQSSSNLSLIIHEDTRFLCSRVDFQNWARGKKQLRMEFFYRKMRQQHHILMDEKGQPMGGLWNYDVQNRKHAKHIEAFPPRRLHDHDEITQAVLKLVAQEFSHHFGQLMPFNFAVTRDQALNEAHDFMDQSLASFGEYQDAMLTQEADLFHSKLSFYLNVGLLLPLELCHMAERALQAQQAPLNSVEGFIRQILGWREYVRGIYWLMMPEYAHRNALNAHRPLPDFYWGKPTSMFCMKEVVRQTESEAYSHHIQRLMVTGNFALLAGLDPKAVSAWYLAVYADAYEWVELPNTLGMALYADGGVLASKPYAASGKYIQKMSNFCKLCAYRPDEVVGEQACPLNALYWNFIHEHRARFQDLRRLHFAYLQWNKMNPDKKQAILDRAHQLLVQWDA
jgi:deoxyribodipyrimidine photolyase-related protein